MDKKYILALFILVSGVFYLSQNEQFLYWTASISTPTTSNNEWCYNFNNNLERGQSGSEIVALRIALTKETGKDIKDPSGKYGIGTYLAVKAFQEKYANEVFESNKRKVGIGRVGESTRKKLNSLFGCKKQEPVIDNNKPPAPVDNTVNPPVVVTPPTVVTPPVVNVVTPQIFVEKDPSSPAHRIAQGRQEITAAKFKISTGNESYILKEITIAVSNKLLSSSINSVHLSDGTKSWDGVLAGTTQLVNTFSGLNLNMPANTSKILTVNFRLGQGFSDNTRNRENIKVSVIRLKAENVSGKYIEITPNVSGNDIYVYRAYPIFANIPVADPGILKSFRISSSSDNQNIAVKQLKFNVEITGGSSATTLDSFKFFKGSTDISSQVAIQTTDGINLKGATPFTSSHKTVVVTFNKEEFISNARNYIRDYALKATPKNFLASNSVSVNILADNEPSTGQSLFYLAGNSDTGVQYLSSGKGSLAGSEQNIIWSDFNSNGAFSEDHKYLTNSSSSDWLNGYLLPGLPL